MWDIIKYIFSGMAIFPVLTFVVACFGLIAFGKERKYAIRMAMDISTIFFIFNVGALLNTLFNNRFGLYGIFLVMIIGAGLLGNSYYRKDGAIPWKKIIRVVWRITFFITVLLYIVLHIIILLKLAFTV